MAKDGFVYVKYERPSAKSAAKVGATIALPVRRPPFVVVDHAAETIIVARWIVKLWLVQIATLLKYLPGLHDRKAKIYRWQYKYHDEPKYTFTRSSLILPGQERQEVLKLIGRLPDTQLSATG